MSRSARWRGQRNKIEEVFKLQFHATQVSLPGANALTLSLVPADIRKPALRLQKAVVRDGICQWEDPAYETIRFVRDPKTGKINKRIYHFIVSSGLSKASLIGEVTVDFSDYAESTEPCTLSLPLDDLNPNTILHVLIHRLRDIVNEIEEEETEDVRMKSQVRSLKSQFSIDDADDGMDANSTEDDPFNKITHNNELSGSDSPLSSFETSSELDTLLQSCEGASDAEIGKLKAEIGVLARRADVTKLELQTLRKQIVKESVRGQDLSNKVIRLREERDFLEAECEKLKAFQKQGDDTSWDVWALVEEIRQELDHEKNQNAYLRIQLQKTQESNEELILAVQDLDEMLGKKEREVSGILNTSGSDDEDQKELEELVKEHVDAKETYMLEQEIADLYSMIKIYRSDKDELEERMEQLALDHEILKQENHDMSYRLEQSALQEQLKTEDQCSCSSANVSVLENQSEESLATVKKLEACIKNLEEDLEKQARVHEVEAKQRAIQAEETLRTTRWKDADAVERIQEELRKLSSQMAATFEANEKVAMKAVAEAGVLRMEKTQLEEMVREANEELKGTKDDYKVKMLELSNLLDLRTNQIEQILLENGKKSKQLKLLQRLLQLKGGVKKKNDEAFNVLEKKLKDHKPVSVRAKTTPRNNRAPPAPRNLKEVENTREKIILSQAEGETSEITLLTELASLKERNKSMESELKEMQDRYSEISVK